MIILKMEGFMFRSDTPHTRPMVTVFLDHQPVSLPGGMTVAAALLARGDIISRISPASGKPCSPHCLMGVCYECLMEINGVQRQACMTRVEPGMVIHRHLDGNHTSQDSFEEKETPHGPSL